MPEENKFDLLDLIVILVKRKFILFFTLIITLAGSYSAIYYFVDEKFESTATIIPSETSSLGGISSMMKGISGAALGLGNVGAKNQIELYNTIIYSRSLLESILDTFQLMKFHKSESREKAILSLKESIITTNNEDISFDIKVRESSPKLAANIVNFIVSHLNRTVINLNIRKSKENREFIQKRYDEVVLNLQAAQDSMVRYQKRTGVIEPEVQMSATVKAIIDLETELAQKEIELEVIQNQVGMGSPQTQPLQTAVTKIKERLGKLKIGKEGSGLTLSIKKLPEDIAGYLSHYRNVEINQKLLEFVLPMYEQAKFEEQKEIPVIQIIDNAIPSEKKVWPPRSLFAILIALGSTFLMLVFLVIGENKELMSSEKMLFIKKNLFRLRVRE
jgi:capsule polysaccharide export protein KpsE/RkpR